MKIVLFEDNIPLKPTNGGHIATVALIDFLREHGEVHVVNVISNPELIGKAYESETMVLRSEALVNNKLRTIFSSYPKVVLEIEWKQMMDELSAVIDTADRIVFGTARFLHLLRYEQVKRKKTFYIADNVEWELVLSMPSNYRSPFLAKLDASRMRMLEAKGIAAVGKAAGFTGRDSAKLAALSGRSVETIPPILAPSGRPTQHREPFALYPTNLNHPPNKDALEWFLADIWPKRTMDWHLVVTGAGDFESYRREGIDFRGFVSREALDDLYDRCGVVINPTRTGSGYQIKLLEALSCGCPVVSTEFSNPLGDAIPSADDPAEFARHVEEQLRSPEAFDYESYYQETRRKLAAFLELD